MFINFSSLFLSTSTQKREEEAAKNRFSKNVICFVYIFINVFLFNHFFSFFCVDVPLNAFGVEIITRHCWAAFCVCRKRQRQ